MGDLGQDQPAQRRIERSSRLPRRSRSGSNLSHAGWFHLGACPARLTKRAWAMSVGSAECLYILLVEDDEHVRFIINEYLCDSGFQVDVAGTVTAACSLLADSRAYNLVITDGRLPDGNGLMIAQRASEQSLKVILISGFPQELAAAERAQYPVLAKPFRLTVLSKVIGDTLSAIC